MTMGLNDKRQNVLAKWLDLVLMYPQESKLGRLLLDCAERHEDDRKVLRLVEDWLARKSTSTLQTRASSFALFVAFFRKYIGDEPIIPIEEEHVYSYIDFLCSSQKPPTRAHTFLSTLTFVANVFGWHGAEEAGSSQRVQGAAHLFSVSSETCVTASSSSGSHSNSHSGIMLLV